MDSVDTIATIAAELPCLQCGYNLRMQPVQGRCPECGNSVQTSLDHTALRWAPDHLRRLGRCALWVAVTTMLMPTLYVVGNVAVVLLANWLLRAPHLAPADSETYLFYVVLMQACAWAPVFALAVFHVVVIWRGTRPPPLRKLGTPEILMRIGTLLFLVAMLEPAAMALLNALRFRLFAFGPALDSWYSSLQRAIIFSLTFFLLGLVLYPWQAAVWIKRIYRQTGPPAPKALTQWSLLAFSAGVLLLVALVAAAMILDWISPSNVPPFVQIAFALSALAGAAATFAGIIGAVIALFLFRRRMNALAAMAPHSPDDLTATECRPDPLPGPSTLA